MGTSRWMALNVVKSSNYRWKNMAVPTSLVQLKFYYIIKGYIKCHLKLMMHLNYYNNMHKWTNVFVTCLQNVIGFHNVMGTWTVIVLIWVLNYLLNYISWTHNANYFAMIRNNKTHPFLLAMIVHNVSIF